MRLDGGGYDGARCKRQGEKGAWCGSVWARIRVWLVEGEALLRREWER